MDIWDRNKATMVKEKVPAGRFLAAVYHPFLYWWFGWLLYGRVWASRLLGRLARTGWSKSRIDGFIRAHRIDMDESIEATGDFNSFNDFFIRRLRSEFRPWDAREDLLACPADCRALVFASWPNDRRLRVKGVDFSLSELLAADRREESEFAGGPVMIARLAPVDCHRFHFPAAGRVQDFQMVPGRYDSVHPLALRRRNGILAANSRHVTRLNLDNFGVAVMVEVGAFAVADIVQHYSRGRFAKMDEKGYFNFGGSTIVLVLQPGSLLWDQDLLEMSARGVETRLYLGERIAMLAV